MIYVLNQNETIIDILEPNKERYYYNDLHVQDLKEGYETFEFTTNVNISDNSTIVLRTSTGDLYPFIVQRRRDLRNEYQEVSYYCDAEYLELRYTRILEPQLLGGQTPESALNFGLQGTRWRFGYTDVNVTSDIEINEYMNILKYIRLVATEMDLELRFRVEFSDNSIGARYVDLVQRSGLDNGKEILFGKDMQSIERIEDTSAVVTALYGVAGNDDKGNPITIATMNGGKPYVEDMNALQRWGKDGEHRFDVFSPPVDQKHITPTLLLDLTKKELKRRVNSVITYKVDAVDLYDVLGEEHERVHVGDTVRIKDEYYEPFLYVEARVIRTERSYTDPSRNKYTLGDYVEIDPYNYKRYKGIENVLNENKEKWNNAEDNAVGRAQLIITQTEESWNATVEGYLGEDGSITQQISQINLDINGVVLSVNSVNEQVGTLETSISVMNGEISSKVSHTDFNGTAIWSMISQTPSSVKIKADNIQLDGITTVADELNLGTDFSDSVSKGIYFRGIGGGVNIVSPQLDHLNINSMESLKIYSSQIFFQGGEVDFSDVSSIVGLPSSGHASTADYANYAGYLSGGWYPSDFVKNNASSQDISIQVNGDGTLFLYVNGKEARYFADSWTG